jgi:hypothetical protein
MNREEGNIESPTTLEPVAWGDPEGKGMMTRISEIEFDDDFTTSREIQSPLSKPAEKPPEPQAKEEKAPEKPVEKPVEEAPSLIDEDFFGGIEEKEEPKEEAKPAEGFDEKAFDAETEEQSKGLDLSLIHI